MSSLGESTSQSYITCMMMQLGIRPPSSSSSSSSSSSNRSGRRDNNNGDHVDYIDPEMMMSLSAASSFEDGVSCCIDNNDDGIYQQSQQQSQQQQQQPFVHFGGGDSADSVISTGSIGISVDGGSCSSSGGGGGSGMCMVCYDDFEDDDDDDEFDNNYSDNIHHCNVATACCTPQQQQQQLQQQQSRYNNKKKRRMNLRKCHHSFCRECIKEYCQQNIAVRRVPIPCPSLGSSQSCDEYISSRDVKEALLPITVTKRGQRRRSRQQKQQQQQQRQKQEQQQQQQLLLLGEDSENSATSLLSSTNAGDVVDADADDEKEVALLAVNDSELALAYADYQKYKRLKILSENASYTACPRCDEPVAPPPPPPSSGSYAAPLSSSSSTNASKGCCGDVESMKTTCSVAAASATSAVVVNDNEDDEEEEDTNQPPYDPNERHCTICHHTFCFEHGDGHLGISCTEYCNKDMGFSKQEIKSAAQQVIANQILETERVIREWTVPCSHCGISIFKVSGCDHVVCPACHQDMCFRCGTHHYLTGKVIRSCTKCSSSYVDHRYNVQYRLRLCLCLPLMIPGWILYSVITGTIALLTGCFCCCFFCGSQAREPIGSNNQRIERPPAIKEIKSNNKLNITMSSSSSSSSHGSSHACSSNKTQRNNHKRNNNSNTSFWSKFDPMLGIRRGTAMIFLPFLAFLRDFGIDLGVLDALLASDVPSEMPVMNTMESFSSSDGSIMDDNNNNNVGLFGNGDDIENAISGNSACLFGEECDDYGGSYHRSLDSNGVGDISVCSIKSYASKSSSMTSTTARGRGKINKR